MFDTENKYLIVPRLFGENSFWKTWDWQLAFREGMKTVDLEYSGVFDFIETVMYIPVHHTVAPKEQSVKCCQCHHKTKSVMDWKVLGYPGDPMGKGGRVKNGLVRD